MPVRWRGGAPESSPASHDRSSAPTSGRMPGQSSGSRAAVSRQDRGMTAQPADSPLTWSLVVPVKVLARAKSRLAVLAGPHRPALALAMAADTVAAALACPVVDRVIAVTDDAEAAGVLAGLGALVIEDEPGRGLNPALRHGAEIGRASCRERVWGDGVAG